MKFDMLQYCGLPCENGANVLNNDKTFWTDIRGMIQILKTLKNVILVPKDPEKDNLQM